MDEAINSVVLLVGLAVGVDYSLFYLRREREERASRALATRPRSQIAAATSGHAVLVSGLTVMIAMAGMFLAGNADLHRRSPSARSWSSRSRCSAR